MGRGSGQSQDKQIPKRVQRMLDRAYEDEEGKIVVPGTIEVKGDSTPRSQIVPLSKNRHGARPDSNKAEGNLYRKLKDQKIKTAMQRVTETNEQAADNDSQEPESVELSERSRPAITEPQQILY